MISTGIKKDAPVDDEQLIMKRIADGDADALGILYSLYGNPVLRLAGSLLSHEDAAYARDICHEVFITVFEKASGYKDDGRLKAWILGITAFKAKAWRRKQMLRKYLMRKHISGSIHTGPQYDNSLEQKIDDEEKKDEIRELLSALPNSQYEVMVLYILEDMSGKEISEILKINEISVWSRLKRAKANLRNIKNRQP